MEYRRLGKTDIKVSCLCLGTMTWGQQNDQRDAHRQLDYARNQGINFIDTAEMYPVPPRPETCGQTEICIGSWPGWKKNRHDIILASKIAGPGLPHLDSGREDSPFSRKSIRQALHQSLTRLQTDYIDLYQIHWPERTTNRFGKRDFERMADETFTPFEKILSFLEELRQEGKIRAIGISNETPWGTMEYLKVGRHAGLPRVASIQNPYGLLNRTFEIGLSEIALREDCGLLAYSPLGFGVLSGKYLSNPPPPKSRLALFPEYKRYQGSRAIEATRNYVRLASRYNLSPAAMALQFVTTRPFVTSNIIGATTMEQLQENISSTELVLPAGVLQEIERIHDTNPNPAP